MMESGKSRRKIYVVGTKADRDRLLPLIFVDGDPTYISLDRDAADKLHAEAAARADLATRDGNPIRTKGDATLF